MKKNRALTWNVMANSGENARRILPRMAREFFAVGRVAAKPNSTPAQLHAFRLSAKRFRYTLELFEPMYGPMLAERLEQVRKIQGVLGERQDCVVLKERLRKRAGDAGLMRDVLAKLDAEGHALENKFRRYWRESFDSAGAETLWIRHLERRPVEPGAPRGAIRKNAGRKPATKKTAPAARRG
jgi:hypothetical protein